jgi:quercetin dioxygenase-like cupin family protein
VTLQRGCVVPVHAHANEQFSCVLSGRVRFQLEGGDRELGPGEVLHLPSHAPHGATALETAVVLDVFAPPSATTGVDAARPQAG